MERSLFQDLNPQTNYSQKEQSNLLELIVNLTKNMSKKSTLSMLLNPKTKEELLMANFNELNVLEQVLALLMIQHPYMTLEEAKAMVHRV